MPKVLVFDRGQAIAEGLTPRQIRQRVNAGEWIEVFPRVYTHRATQLTPLLLRAAALQWAGSGAALSHRSAGEMWALDRVHETVPELILRSERQLRTGAALTYRRTNLLRTDVAHRD